GTLAHGAQPNTRVAIAREAATVICHYHPQCGAITVVCEVDSADAGVGICVADDIGKCLLYDAVGSNLNCGGQRWQGFGGLDRDTQGCPFNALDSLVVCRLGANSSDKAQVVERGWAEIVDKTANVGESSPCLSDHTSQQLLGLRDIGAEQVAGSLGPEGDGG